jgi:hypothetical protein
MTNRRETIHVRVRAVVERTAETATGTLGPDAFARDTALLRDGSPFSQRSGSLSASRTRQDGGHPAAPIAKAVERLDQGPFESLTGQRFIDNPN